jgi:lambda family phage portal protein
MAKTVGIRKEVSAHASISRRGQAGIEAGQNGRRLSAVPTSTLAINSQIRAFGRNALARSRYLCINNPTMSQAKAEFSAALVGDGIKPSFVVKDIAIKRELQDLWTEWTDESDADGLTDFYGQQSIAADELFEAGEVFARLRPRRVADGFTVPMQLQLLPSEMCPLDYNLSLPGGARIECGVQFSPIGVREGYWFYKNHPGEATVFNTTDAGKYLYFIPANQIIHLFKPIRAGQIRGVPHTLAGILTAAILDLYDDAELERKRTAALFSAFIKRNAAETDGENPLTGAPTDTNSITGQTTAGMEPGATVELLPGQDIAFSSPTDVGNNYEAFEYRNLLRVSAGVGIPYMNLTGDLRQANYGSQRGGLITFKRRISNVQNSVMVFQFCRPIARAFLDAAVLSGAVEGFTPAQYATEPRAYGQKIKWVTPKWDWIDPLKDLTAEKLAVDSGFKCRSEVIQAMGNDAEEVDEAIAQDQERADELGISFIQLNSGVTVSPTSEDLTPDPVAAPGDPAAPNNDSGLKSNSSPPKNPSKGAKGARKKKRKPGPYGTTFIWDA